MASAAKIYAPEHIDDVDSAVLEDMVRLPRQLSAEDSSWLLGNTAWPAVITEKDGTVCGFLMRMVPGDFHFDFRTRTLGSQRKLADIAFLLNADSYVTSAGITVNDRQRLLLLKSIALLLDRFHRMAIVVGDLSPKNLLFTLSPSPGCFLIDCDAARFPGRRPAGQDQPAAEPDEDEITQAEGHG